MSNTPKQTGTLSARYTTIKEVADILACDRSTVSRLLKRAGIPKFKFGRGRNALTRYLQSDVERFIELSRESST